MVRIPDFAPAFGRPPNSYDGMRTIMLVHQPFFLFLLPPLFPVHPFFLTTAGESWSCLPLNDQRVCVSWLKKKKEKKCKCCEEEEEETFRWMRRWDETEERILVEAWMKGRKKERKKKRVQVTIRKYERLYFRHKKRVFNKKKKKEPLVSRNLSHKLKSYLKLKVSQVILRRYISVLNIASIYDLPFVYISINV